MQPLINLNGISAGTSQDFVFETKDLPQINSMLLRSAEVKSKLVFAWDEYEGLRQVALTLIASCVRSCVICFLEHTQYIFSTEVLHIIGDIVDLENHKHLIDVHVANGDILDCAQLVDEQLCYLLDNYPQHEKCSNLL